MPTVRDTARIRDITSRPIDLDVPNVDDPEALEADAKLVWERLINVNITPNCLERKRNGQPGRIWRGRILAENFYKLWPRLADRVMVPKAEGDRLTGAIMTYLKQCGMLHCLETTTKHNAAVWWVADHWQPLRISHVVDETPVGDAVAESEPESEPEPEPTEDGEFKCRLCNHRFDLTSARGGHEYRSHRAVVGADGKVYQYDAADYTPTYMGDCVMRVLEKAEKPLSFNALAGGCYEYDPRLGKPVVRRLLLELIAAGAVREVKKGVHPLYELDRDTASVTPAPAEGIISGFVNDIAKLSAPKTTAPPVAPPGDLPATVAYAEHVVSTALGNLRAVQESLQVMPQQLDEMRNLLAEKDKAIEVLRAKLIHQAASSPETEAKLKAALEELEKVKIERDGYKASVEAFRAALSGIVKD